MLFPTKYLDCTNRQGTIQMKKEVDFKINLLTLMLEMNINYNSNKEMHNI